MARDGIINDRAQLLDKPHVATSETRVERGIQLVSRWAGILAFVAGLAGVCMLIF